MKKVMMVIMALMLAFPPLVMAAEGDKDKPAASHQGEKKKLTKEQKEQRKQLRAACRKEAKEKQIKGKEERKAFIKDCVKEKTPAQ